MTKKIKIFGIIGGVALLLGAGIGAGVGIGLSISKQNEQNIINEQKRVKIIETRTYVNEHVSDFIKNYITLPDFTQNFTWKQEYGDFLKSLYFPPNKNIDINKPWYENYGPLYQNDRSYYSGKLIIFQENNTLIDAYEVTYFETDNTYQVRWMPSIWEILDKKEDGTWNERAVFFAPVVLTFSADF